MVLPQSLLSAPYLHRTAAHGGRALGPAYVAARPALGRPRASRWGARPGCVSATRGTCSSAGTHCCVGCAGSLPRRCPRPRVLGVDDLALRKRHTYGTILVDLERRQPLALLPERTAEPVAQWLREHPGVEVIARDRASAYAEGARQGASKATQVADRFHLLQNLRETLDQVFTTHHHALNAVNEAVCQQPIPLPDGTVAVPVPPPATPPLSSSGRPSARRSGRRATSRSGPSTARAGRAWPLLPRWAAAAAPSSAICTCRRGRCGSIVATMGAASSIRIRPISSSAGTPGATPPSNSFRRSNCAGTPGAIAVSRPMSAVSARPRASHPAARAAARSCRSWRSLSLSPYAPPGDVAGAATRGAAHRGRDPAARPTPRAVAHSRRGHRPRAGLCHLVRQRQPERLDPWLTRATASALEAMQRFAHGLRDDYAAVKAGVTLPWRSGPVEGHINRLKMLKRQMFGRAHLDLLSRRFLRAPRERKAQVAATGARTRSGRRAGRVAPASVQRGRPLHACGRAVASRPARERAVQRHPRMAAGRLPHARDLPTGVDICCT